MGHRARHGIAMKTKHFDPERGQAASASVNITDDDTPKIPANGYTITDLGDTTHTSTYAAAINNAAGAQVAGSFVPLGSPSGYYRAFQWSTAGFTDIVPPPGTGLQYFMAASGLNNSGWTVGYGFDQSGNPPFYWLWNGVNTITLQKPTPNQFSVDPAYGPRAINDANWIVGAAKNSQFGVYRAIRWDAGGSFVFLGGLSGNESLSAFAWAMSSGTVGHRVAGESRFDLNVNAVTTAYHAFRTRVGTQPLPVIDSGDLGNSPASETSSSGAYAINNLFEIVGYSASSATEMRAAYKDGNSGKHKGWRILGVLPGGAGAGLSAQALGMSDVGLIVGWSRTATTGNGNPKAVVWENYQSPVATDLNLKIPVADRANWSLQYATGINATGRIVGYGLKSGVQRAFLLTPVP